MSHGLHLVQVALMAASVAMPILGITFLWITRRTLAGLLLGLAVCLWGLFWLAFGTGMAMVETGNAGGAWLPFTAGRLIYVVMVGGILGFGIVYPGLVLDRWHKLGLAATGLATVGLLVLVLLDRSWVVTLSGPSDSYWTVLDLALAGALLAVVLLLGRRWLASPPGERRTQITWALLPFLFWILMDGLVFHVYPVFLGPRHGLTWWLADPVTLLIRGLLLAGMAAGLALAGLAMARVVSGDPEPDERGLAFVTLYLLPVTLLPVLDPGYSQGQIPDVHPLLLTLFVVLILYGVGRYSIVDLDLKVKWGLEKSTIFGALGVTFLIVSEVVEALLNIDGFLVGVGGAVAIGLVFRRVESAAEHLTNRLVPRARDPSTYLEGRRSAIYRAQAQSLLADDAITGKERSALDRLRVELGLDPEEASRIEDAVRQAL